MSKSIAVLIYGQPRFLESGLKWRAAYFQELRKIYPDLQVDFYYHLWDGVEYTRIVEYVGNEDMADLNQQKRWHCNQSPWTTFANDVPVEPTVIKVNDLHSELGLTVPRFHSDRTIMYRSKFDHELRKEVQNICFHTFKEMCSNTSQVLDFVDHCEANYNTWGGLLASPIGSMGYAYELFQKTRNQDYDVIMITRTDSVINPYSLDGMKAMLDKDCPFEFPWEDNFYILEHSEIAFYNTIGIRSEDFIYFWCHKTLDIAFSNWREKLIDMIVLDAVKGYWCQRGGIKHITETMYAIHSAVFELTRTRREKDSPTIHFKRVYGSLDDQTLIRSGAENLEPTPENYSQLKQHMVDMIGNRELIRR